jgi:replication factor C small subunit
VCEGDLRTAINLLQTAASTTDHITEKDIYVVSNSAQPQDILNLIEACLSKDFLKARTTLETLLFDHGLSGEDIISHIYKKIIAYPEDKIPIDKKTKNNRQDC